MCQEWSDLSTHGLLFQWASTNCMLVQDKADINTSSKCSLFLPWYIWKIAQMALNNNHSTDLNRRHKRDDKSFHGLWPDGSKTVMFICKIIMESRGKKSLKIPKGYSEAVNRRTDNTMAKRKRTNDDLQICKLKELKPKEQTTILQNITH